MMQQKAKRLTWSREPREKGLAGTCQLGRGPRGWRLSYGKGNVVGRVSYSRDHAAWYWYGCGHNSLWDGITYPTDGMAKAVCLAHCGASVG